MARLGRGRPHPPIITLAIVTVASITGSIATVEAADVMSAAGSPTVSGTIAVTENNDTQAAAGAPTITGTIATVEANDTMAGSGGSGTQGSFTWTEANDTSAAAGTPTVTGTLTWTEANDVMAAVGAPRITGTIAVTDANDTAAMAGGPIPGAPTGLTATPASGQVGLTWTAPAAGPVTDYLVQYRIPVSFPVSVDATHRKLLDASGNVVMMHTFSSWGMSQNLSNSDITLALTSLRTLGFNAVTVSPCGQNYGGTWDRYHNLAGNPFFTGTPYASTFGSAWSSMDWIMTEATRLGMFVLFSLYSGSGNSQGGGDEMIAAGTTNMYNHGVRVATRYAAYNNIIWHYGADQGFNYGTDPSTMVDAYFHGIRDTEGGTHRLVVAEPDQYPTTSYSQFNNQAYVYFHCDVNSVYQYFQDPISYFDSVWGQSGATSMPVWDCEPPYLGAPYYTDEDSGQRARHWTTYIRGGCGINLSDEDWWPFGKAQVFGSGDWHNTPTKTSVKEMGYTIPLIDAYMLDTSWAPVSTLVTTGAATDVAQGASASAAIAYFPSSRTIVLDTTIIAGTGNVRLRWYDPSTTGTYTTIAASEAQNASRSVTHPGTNSVGDTDWVLIVDDGTTHTPPTSGTWQTFTDGVSTTPSATVTGLTNGVQYEFQVAATNGAGTGAFSTSVLSIPLAADNATLAWTEANDTMAAVGSPTITGTIATTEANDTMAAAGAPRITGTIATTEANDVMAGAGTLTASGTIAVTEANDAMSGAGTSPAAATIAWTEASDIMVAAGAAGTGATGAIATVEANDIMAGSGTPQVTGTIAWTENNDTEAAAGTPTITGTITTTGANDVMAAAGAQIDVAGLTWTEQDDTMAAAGSPRVTGTLSWTEANDTMVAAGAAGSGATGGIATVEGNDVMVAAGTGVKVATLAWTEANDTFNMHGNTGSIPTLPIFDGTTPMVGLASGANPVTKVYLGTAEIV